MAVHAVDVLENARIVNDLPAALVGWGRVQQAIATTVRSRSVPGIIVLETPEMFWKMRIVNFPAAPSPLPFVLVVSRSNSRRAVCFIVRSRRAGFE